MEAQVAAFKAANKGFTGTISLLASVGEGDVKTELLKDPEAAADVMCIADDNISPAVTGRALTAIGKTTDSTTKGSVIRKILAHQGSAALSAVSVGTNVYGYPYRNDNGYCLIYDKRIVSDAAAASMEGILAACKTGNATFNYDLGTAWYGASYLWANGCTTSTDTDGKFHASFANDNGVAAALAAQALYTTYGGTNWLFSTDTTKFGVEGTGRVGAVVLWNNYDALKTAVGEANIGVAALPTIKIGDSNKALKSFMGFKAMYILGWTIVWAFFATFTNYLFGIILALLINKKGIRLKKMWRTIFVITVAIPQFITLLAMRKILGDGGPISTWFYEKGWVSSLGTFWLNDQAHHGLSAKITLIVVNMQWLSNKSSDTARCAYPTGAYFAESDQVSWGASEKIKEAGSLTAFYAQVLALRKAHPILASGIYNSLSKADSPVSLLEISLAGQTAYLATNFDSSTATLNVPSGLSLAASLDVGGVSSLSGSLLSLTGYSTVFLQKTSNNA